MKMHISKHWFCMLYMLSETIHLYFKLFLIPVELNSDTDHRRPISICLTLVGKNIKEP